MYKEINEIEFISEFRKAGVENLFTVDALKIMFKYLQRKEQGIMDFYIVNPLFLSDYFTEYTVEELEQKENRAIEEIAQTEIVIWINKERILIYGNKK